MAAGLDHVRGKPSSTDPLQVELTGSSSGSSGSGGDVRRPRLDPELRLVAGCFSSIPETSIAFGLELGLPQDRVYSTYQEMIEKEKEQKDGVKMVFVVIVTPNPLHFEVSQAFLCAGFPVLCDKPLTTSLADADRLVELIKQTGLPFGLTHNYSGYPMVKEARDLVQSRGKLGTIRKVIATYTQGWLTSGPATITRSRGVNSLVDVGTHAEHLMHYITGLEIEQLCADVNTFVGGVREPDDFNILLRFKGGSRGVLIATQVSTGKENDLKIEIYGSEASLEWRQEEPNYLTIRYRDAPHQILTRGSDYLSPIAKYNTRLPSGHPEGYLEAFANIYINFANTVQAKVVDKTECRPFDEDFPTVHDGRRGVHFCEKVYESAKKGTWVNF